MVNKKFIYSYKQSLINTIIMENTTEYILIKEITAKENRKNLFKVIGYSALSGIFGVGVMYFFLYFILWANEITDKLLGIS